MTQETFDKATHIDHDITILKNIKFEQDKNNWVSFNTPSGKEYSFWDSTIQDDFQDFIATELVKAQKMLEEL
jgi:hypothetical protein